MNSLYRVVLLNGHHFMFFCCLIYAKDFLAFFFVISQICAIFAKNTEHYGRTDRTF